MCVYMGVCIYMYIYINSWFSKIYDNSKKRNHVY